MSKEQEITELCQPFVTEMGFEWVGVEYHHHPKEPTLRIYLDKEGGISMEDIVYASERLNPFFDEHNPIDGFYHLEISSPGLDRRLFTLNDFVKFTGQMVKIQLKIPLNRRRKFEGLILGVEDDKIQLQYQDGKELKTEALPFAQIDKARLIPQF